MLNKVSAYFLLVIYSKKLNKYGIKPIIENIENRYEERKGNEDWEQMNSICKKVNEAGSMLQFRNTEICLQRSMVGYFLLRKLGFHTIEFHIGVGKETFEAHAWLECDGNIINDDEEFIRKRYIPTFSK
ncbi:lasso peptide biosynthesis B2 protein [Terribacillus sp. AE2B 122]|uniref:lasso peptide biosynthesis B2 protein n=1 Tax=Terribacillus sp. AE2B 122 TaxID=1331902 RepID=UPI001581767A|nr:lasso peptide biosynthesis B2 protein [Terribacillus sp. AE2B 122]